MPTKCWRFLLPICIVQAITFSYHDGAAQTSPSGSKELNAKLARGWNTWSYGSMLSHVLLPEGLVMKVNFRQTFIGTPYDPDYFFESAIVDKKGLVRPIAHTIDGSYTELLIDGWKGNRIKVQSAASDKDLVILITPMGSSQNIHYTIELETGFMWNRPGMLAHFGDHIKARCDSGEVLISSSRKPIASFQAYTTPYLVCTGDSTTAFYTGPSKTIDELKDLISKAEQNYHLSVEQYYPLEEAYKAIQSVLGWNTLYDAGKSRVITPVTRGWNEAWQGYVLFNWDTYFASLLSAAIDRDLAYANALAITKGDTPGHVGFWQMPGYESVQSQPPVGSMVCWMVYKKFGDKWFLREIFQDLLAWNRWWAQNRLNQGYLTWGAPWEGAGLREITLESGLDNSPMYEHVSVSVIDGNSLFDLADVGLNSLYVADCHFLAQIAGELGLKKESQELRSRGERFAAKVRTLWSEKHGLFLNKDLKNGKFSERITPALFYPMIASIPTKAQSSRMIKEHFYNPEEFYGEYLMPSCARNDPSFDNNYWRGSIWGPMNFLVYVGLKNYDQNAAAELASNSYGQFIKAWTKHGSVFENINSVRGVESSRDQINSDPYYHWGALMGLMEIIEQDKFTIK